MSHDPFFSVVIPVYNRASTIESVVSRILDQSYTNFEIVLVNDGSTDNVLEVLKSKYSIHPKIKIFTGENRERGAARNKGFKNATGHYVIFFDSDDLMHADHLEVLHQNIEKLNEPFFIATKFDFIDEQGKKHSSDIQKLKEGYYDYTLFLNGNPLACNVCVKRENPKLQLFEEDRNYSIKEDWMFLVQNTYNEKLYIIDKVTITMSDHESRSMRSNNRLIIQRTFAAAKWIMNKINLSIEEKKVLNAHVNYFCSIHAYLENKRSESFRFALNAIRNGGLKSKYVSMLIKSLVGRKLIKAIQ